MSVLPLSQMQRAGPRVNVIDLEKHLNARIRDVQVFADGAVYVLTEGANGTLLKVTPKAK